MNYNTSFPPFEGSDGEPGDHARQTQEQRPSTTSSYSGQGNQGGWQNRNQNQGNWQNRNQNQGGGSNGWKPRPQDPDTSTYRPYALILDKNVPPDILAKAEALVKNLSEQGYTLRIGMAEEFESRFEALAERKEVILPWRDFNNHTSKLTFTNDRALAVAKQFHPTFDSMKPAVQKFLARNARLIFGSEMKSRAIFLICWTEDGCEHVKDRLSSTGFVGHPIAIASSEHVPVFNLARPETELRLQRFLEPQS